MVYLFPIALLAFLGWFFVRLCAGRSFAGRPGAREPIGRGDLLPLALLTAAALLLGFLGLGNTTAPQTFYQFDSEHHTLTLILDREYQVSRIVTYNGGNHASEGYALAAAREGGEFATLWRHNSEGSSIAALAHDYTNVYKWVYTSADKLYDAAGNASPTRPVKALRLHAGGDALRLGCIALYDENHRLIPAEHIRFEEEDGSAGNAAALLTDDYAIIPESQDYRNSTYFDEIYHARTAYELLHGLRIYETTHPPLGKLIIAAGIALFGMTPFGWRFSGALFGALMVPLFYLMGRRIFRRRPALCASVVFLFDFMRFAQTRISTIDTYCVFFTLLMYWFMLLFLCEPFDGKPVRQLLPLALCGVSFGLGAASKWQCLYAAFGLVLLYAVHVISEGVRMCRAGRRDAYLRRLAAVLGVSVLCFVVIAAGIYYLSYVPYAKANGETLTLKYVIDRQKGMYDYHSKLTATHPYQSVWYQWVLDLRPILYYRKYPATGLRSLIAAWLSPVAAWGGLAALVCEDVLSIRARYGELSAAPEQAERNRAARRRFGFLTAGYLSMLVPWLGITRCAFAYHYFPCLIFLCLALAAVFERWEDKQPGGRGGKKRSSFRWWPEVFAAVSALLFALFYPALSGVTAPDWWFSLLRWIPSWPL